MQIVAVPLSGKDKTVAAYVIRYMKANNLFSTAQTLSVFDGASQSEALAMLGKVGLEAFTLGKPLFIPINDIMLLGGLDKQCSEPADKIIFVFESKPSQDEPYITAVEDLRKKGYRFALNYRFEPQGDRIPAHCSYIFLSQRPERLEQTIATLKLVRQQYPALEPIATHIYTENNLTALLEEDYALYESRFYRIPSGTDSMLSPEKKAVMNNINQALDESLDFDQFSASIQEDPEVNKALLGIFNAGAVHGSKIKTISQAVSIMGQQEVRRWIATALSLSLGKDKPEEVTRVSLIRAIFARNLAPLYGLERLAGDLFLVGLLSVLDVMVDVPLDQSVRMLGVPGPVRDALAGHTGECYPVLEMIRDYENANWSSVSRHMIVHDIAEKDLGQAYVDALVWYRNLRGQEETTAEPATV